MKELFLIVLISLFSLNCVISQEDVKSGIDKFGIKINAGLTLSKRNVTKDILLEYYTRNDIYKEEIPQPGYEIGTTIHYYFLKNFGLETGVSMSSLKFKTNLDMGNIMGYRITTIQELNYLNIPLSILFKYPVKDFAPYIKAGISGSRLIYATIKKEYLFDDSRKDYLNISHSPGYFKSNYSFSLSTGCDFEIRKTTFSFEITYQKGLKNIYNDGVENSHFPMPIPITDIPDNFKINYVSFTIGWTI